MDAIKKKMVALRKVVFLVLFENKFSHLLVEMLTRTHLTSKEKSSKLKCEIQNRNLFKLQFFNLRTVPIFRSKDFLFFI